MANHELQTTPSSKGIIFKLRYDTYVHWMNSDLILQKGEAAIAAFPSQDPLLPPVAVGIKIGDGRSYFDELPWIQAIASDVYSWAKSSTPPSADTIPGLAQYIQEHAPSGGGGSESVSNTYQIRWDSTSQKYILQYWDETDQEWIDTSSEINLSTIFSRLTSIERWANGATTGLGNIDDPITAIVYDEVIKYLNKLDVNDTDEPHQFVTSVSQTDGKISVSRSIITANDISSGTFSTSQGGTGLTRVEEDEVLVGDRNGEITTRTFVTEITPANRTSFVTAGAIIDYVAEKTANLTGAMHFIGDATIPIPVNSRVDPQINGYNFRDAQPGDVILANGTQELVWTGSDWHLLGDEGSYVIKGSITDADISENANISQSKINNLIEDLESKNNIIEHFFLNDEEIEPSTVKNLPKSIDMHFNGMSKDQSDKLDAIEENAQVNLIENIQLNGTSLPINAKTVNIDITEYTNKLETIETGAQVNKINSITLDGERQTPDTEGNVALVSNPHTDHINIIEHVFINGTESIPTTIEGQPKSVNISIDESALTFQILKGARYPSGANTYTDVEIDSATKKLEISHIAATGDVQHLLQTQGTYIILDCGTSNSDTHPIIT